MLERAHGWTAAVGDVIRPDLGPEMVREVSRILRDSIAYSLNQRDEALDYALQYSRGLDRSKPTASSACM